jgi:hypothetical protein
MGEVLILENDAEFIAHGHIDRAFGKGGFGDTGSLFGDRIDGTGMQTHGGGLREWLDFWREGQYAALPENSPAILL